MLSDSELIILYESFWNIRNRGGYVKVITKATTVVARIKEIRKMTTEDRVVILEDVDINGKPIKGPKFKLSEVLESEEVLLITIKTKA
jgi:5S rRNA maturation endonuclease (ribonuclease M5)